VGETGDLAILYSADLRWRGLSIHYGSELTYRDGLPARTTHSLRKSSIEAEGRWDAIDPPLAPTTIFESEEGAVQWSCLRPRAEASIHGVCGLGYMERLELTLPPWRLPIRQLRWGRFLSRKDAVIWIEWTGDYSKRLAYHNGALVDPSAIAHLRLEDPRVLREGCIGSTVLSAIPSAAKTFPGRLLAVRECKWRSLGHFNGQQGWAIHEVVDWPQD
jgi:hypothetical protein